MSGRTKKRKAWERNRQQKIMRKLSRRKRHRYKQASNNAKKQKKRKDVICVKAPTQFSLLENTDITVEFFRQVFGVIQRCARRTKIFFDLSDIEVVTADAIMYLIAVINNTKRLKILEIDCGGNMPSNKEACRMFERVGFYRFVNVTKSVKETVDSNRIKIKSGKSPDGVVASSICDFVIEKTMSSDIMSTKALYPMLIELMTNVRQHAYDESGVMSPKWFVYVENAKDVVKFVFLDTGLGIPSTVYKKFSEKLREIIPIKNDAKYIEAALLGEFRTETELEYRGKGLPEIFARTTEKNGPIKNLSIISGYGECDIEEDGNISKRNIKNEFDGTLFVWDFVKEDRCL